MKQILLILFSLLTFTHQTQAQPLSIHCETAGYLQDSLVQKGVTDFSGIHSLKVSGHLHAGDFRLFKQMPLDSLDLSEATIDAFFGIGTYEPGMFGSNYAQDYLENSLPTNAFSYRSRYNNQLSGMETLVYIALPNGLKGIEQEAFAGTNLSEIALPDGLESIGTDAFLGCGRLETIQIPASVHTIGKQTDETHYGAFAHCLSLRTIDVDAANETYRSLKGVLFDKEQTLLCQYPAGRDAASYQIPDEVQRIAHNAFYRCTQLEGVTIPASVEVIERAFWNCEKLMKITCEGTIPPKWRALGSTQWVEPFDYKLWDEGTLTVPTGCKDRYKNLWDTWGMFKNIREAEEGTTGIQAMTPADIKLFSDGNHIYIRQTNNEMLDIQIYDTTGKLVKSIQCQALEQRIQVSTKGIYLIHIKTNHHSQTKKIIVV